MQVLWETECTSEEYRSGKRWKTASRPESCPRCRPAGEAGKSAGAGGACKLYRHGSYPRKGGLRIARFRCSATKKTVSRLPDFLAASMTGTLEELEDALEMRFEAGAGSVE